MTKFGTISASFGAKLTNLGRRRPTLGDFGRFRADFGQFAGDFGQFAASSTNFGHVRQIWLLVEVIFPPMNVSAGAAPRCESAHLDPRAIDTGQTRAEYAALVAQAQTSSMCVSGGLRHDTSNTRVYRKCVGCVSAVNGVELGRKLCATQAIACRQCPQAVHTRWFLQQAMERDFWAITALVHMCFLLESYLTIGNTAAVSTDCWLLFRKKAGDGVEPGRNLCATQDITSKLAFEPLGQHLAGNRHAFYFEIDLSGAKVGQFRPKFGPGAAIPRTSAQERPNLSRIRTDSVREPNLARNRPTSARERPNLARARPTSARERPNLARTRQTSENIARNRPRWAPNRPQAGQESGIGGPELKYNQQWHDFRRV